MVVAITCVAGKRAVVVRWERKGLSPCYTCCYSL